MAKKYGKWTIKSDLGQGGQAHVFLVQPTEDTSSGLFALKRIKNPKQIARFRNEIEAALKLDHPNIVKCIDYDLSHESPFMVTEHCSGGTLSDSISANWSTLNRLRLFLDVCQGVEYAHSKNVIHRDLKPENIFIREDGKTPVIGDFGICLSIEQGERVTLTDEAVGSRFYMAPELEDGRADSVTPRVDVYSLGKILYWLFAGRLFTREGKHREDEWNLTGPFVDLPPFKISERALVNELIDQSVTEKPEERFHDGKHFRANVERAIWRLENHGHVTDLSERLICSFCGNGEYRLVANSVHESGSHNTAALTAFGGSTLSGSKWIILCCDHCGNVQQFRIDHLGNNPWKNLA